MVVKSKEEAKANFEAAISYIPARYEAGVSKADWATPAKSAQAEKNYADGVSKAVAGKTRQKAIAGVSNEEWKSAAIAKGVPIIGDRIRLSLDKWLGKWGPMYDSVVSKVGTLPPKTTDWRANINTRLVPVVETWKRAAGKT
uniref:Uncharacterized protein n=1 Tax=viral metagenome TaxID=1070528 RepID=A0A6H1ZKZ5_9ZZZZ